MPQIDKKHVGGIVTKYLKSKGLPLKTAVTFADVFIVDRKSRIRKRSDITNLGTRLARNLHINIPIVSANMADVTESKMAITLARLGGFGFIHQFLPIERRAEEIKKVKRADNEVIDEPWTIHESTTLQDFFNRFPDGGGVLVVNDRNQLVGILTERDVRFIRYDASEKIKFLEVKDVMTSMPLVTARPGISVEEAIKILEREKLEKLPLVSDRGEPVGLITIQDILKKYIYPNAARDRRGRLLVGASVGISGRVLEEVSVLVRAGADAILVDTARGNAEWPEDVIKDIRVHFPELPIVAGNVDNPEGAFTLAQAGADCVKVGIGPGSACKTRTETGVGMPQLSAIAECAAVARELGVTVMADGGIREGGDLAKAIAAGADTVMLGGLLAGTEETPGEVFYDGGEIFKAYRGSAGLDTQLARMDQGNLDRVRAPEGVTRKVPFKGQSAITVVQNLMENLRSSMSYANAATIAETQTAKLRFQTAAGFYEGQPKK